MAYYYYKLTTDNGGAPCVYQDVLTLAICKPQIRATAKEGDWLFGFGGKSALGERLIYIAKVTKKLWDGAYYRDKEYQSRPDCIYKWRDGKLCWRAGSQFHIGGEDSDIGPPPHRKAVVLISTDFRYLGSEGTAEYKERFTAIREAVSKLRRGHRVNHPDELEIELTSFRENVWQQFSDKAVRRPSQDDKLLACNKTDGSFKCGSC